jgi:hypothetical protein
MKRALLLSIALPLLTAQATQAAPLESGNYASQGSMYASSYRIVASKGDGQGPTGGHRTCLQIVNGPPRPYAGYSSIDITSLTNRNGTYFTDNDNTELTINSPTEFQTGSRSGLWQKIDFDRAPLSAMQKCLSSNRKYSYSTQGPYIPGQILEKTQAKLIDRSPTEKINVRQNPGTDAKILHYGLVGDRVTLLLGNTDRFGDIWYFVKFRSGGAEGWVHSKLIQRL